MEAAAHCMALAASQECHAYSLVLKQKVNTQNVLFFCLKDKKYVQVNRVKSGTTLSVT